MNNPGKPREDHRGQPAPHLGQDHYEKSQLERAAGSNDWNATDAARKAVELGDNISPIPAAMGAGNTLHVEPELAHAEEDLNDEESAPGSG